MIYKWSIWVLIIDVSMYGMWAENSQEADKHEMRLPTSMKLASFWRETKSLPIILPSFFLHWFHLYEHLPLKNWYMWFLYLRFRTIFHSVQFKQKTINNKKKKSHSYFYMYPLQNKEGHDRLVHCLKILIYGGSFNVTPSAIPLTSRCQKRHEHVPAKLDQC